MFKFKFKSIAPPSQNPSTKIRQNPYRLYDNPKWTDFVVIDENREGIFRFPGVTPLPKPPSKDFSYIFIPFGNYLYNVIPSDDIKGYILHNIYFKIIPDNDIFDVNIPYSNFNFSQLPEGELNYLQLIDNNLRYRLLVDDLQQVTIPANNLNYSDLLSNDLRQFELTPSGLRSELLINDLRQTLLVNDLQQGLIPFNNFRYFELTSGLSYTNLASNDLGHLNILPNDIKRFNLSSNDLHFEVVTPDVGYYLISNDLKSSVLQNQSLGYNNIPLNDILHSLNPLKPSLVLIPDAKLTYNPLQSVGPTYNMIPINDLNKKTTDLDNISHGLIPLIDFLPKNIPLSNESHIFIPQSKISYSFLSSINEYNYIPLIDNVNLLIPNIISRYSSLLNNDLSYSMLEPGPPPPPTFYVTGGGTSHVFNAQGGIVWNGYGSNYLSVGFSQEGEAVPPQAGWYFVDDVGTIRQLLNDTLWFSGGAPSPYPNGAGWLAVSNGPFALNESNPTITFYEQQPTVTFVTP